ncbi:MAG: rRNA maturation RNase YbeY, partial [Bacteroidetes bacterium]|nr:rRNA maturation RNase YbeY [Bacteroidota bacterium]
KIENKNVENLSFIFCNDSFLLNLNKNYLNHNTFTDIITFDYTEGDLISGDIFISLDRVEENAIKYKLPFNEELFRVIAHGILHLIGYADGTNAERLGMRAKENDCLFIWSKIIKRFT